MSGTPFPAIAEALRELHRQSVRFVIVRYSADHSPSETELDIIVPVRKKAHFLRRILRQLGGDVAMVGSQHGITGLRAVLVRAPSGEVRGQALALDIREVVRKRDALLCDFDRLVSDGVDEIDGLPVPAPHIEAAFLIARNAWADRRLSARHRDVLERTWSPRALEELESLLVRSHGSSYEEVVANCKRQVVPNDRRATHPATAARVVLQHGTITGLVRRSRPSVLAIHGPDGAGKSTTAALVARQLRETGLRVAAQHYTGGTIDGAYIERQSKKSREMRSARDASQPTLPERQPLPARVRRILLFPARQVQFLVDILRKEKLDVVIYDRFAFDHLFKEASLALSPQVRRAMARTVRVGRQSSRTVNVVLTADPGVIHQRKPEMPADLIRDYYNVSHEYFGDDAAWVEAAEDADSVAASVIAAFTVAIDNKQRRFWHAR